MHLDFMRDPADPARWLVWCTGSWRPVTDVVYTDVADSMKKKVAYRVCSSCGRDVSNRLSGAGAPE